VGRGAGGCICLRCFARETGNTLSMSQSLRHDVTLALGEDAAPTRSGSSFTLPW